MKLNNRIPFVLTSCIAAGFAFYAAGQRTYDYYIFTRWVIFFTCGYGVFLFHKRLWLSPALFYAILGIIFNPLLPFHFQRSAWYTLDIVGGILLLVLLIFIKKRSVAMNNELIFVKSTKTGEQSGPFTSSQIAEQLKNGVISFDDLYWNAVVSGWKKIDDLANRKITVPHKASYLFKFRKLLLLFAILVVGSFVIGGFAIIANRNHERENNLRYRQRKLEELQKHFHETLGSASPAAPENILREIKWARLQWYLDSDIYEALAKMDSRFQEASNARYTLQQVEEELSKVSSNDLKKITLFDVGIREVKQDAEIWGFYGRIRNNLPSNINRLAFKVSIFNSKGELIEVKYFWAMENPDTIIPVGTPISFDRTDSKFVGFIKHLPESYTWKLEVTEAHYVP